MVSRKFLVESSPMNLTDEPPPFAHTQTPPAALCREGSINMKAILGGKGAGLAEMARAGMPVPPGFTISAEGCSAFQGAESTEKLPQDMAVEVEEGLKHIETATGTTFSRGGGATHKALLVSVRSGAAVSMPGMMDTVLNLGINDAVAELMISETKNERFVWDCYRRFIQMYGDVVKGVGMALFDAALSQAKAAAEVKHDHELGAAEVGGPAPAVP
jgi:pyruvate, orthophosphate dikinase